jgi:hypothetical protein
VQRKESEKFIFRSLPFPLSTDSWLATNFIFRNSFNFDFQNRFAESVFRRDVRHFRRSHMIRRRSENPTHKNWGSLSDRRRSKTLVNLGENTGISSEKWEITWQNSEEPCINFGFRKVSW